MRYNERGEEMLDDTPVEAPLKFKRPLSIQELIALHVRAANQVERVVREDEEDLDEDGVEFDDILTPYELHEYSADADREMRRRETLNKVREKANGPGVKAGAGEAAQKQEASGGAAGTGEKPSAGQESSGRPAVPESGRGA